MKLKRSSFLEPATPSSSIAIFHCRHRHRQFGRHHPTPTQESLHAFLERKLIRCKIGRWMCVTRWLDAAYRAQRVVAINVTPAWGHRVNDNCGIWCNKNDLFWRMFWTLCSACMQFLTWLTETVSSLPGSSPWAKTVRQWQMYCHVNVSSQVGKIQSFKADVGIKVTYLSVRSTRLFVNDLAF